MRKDEIILSDGRLEKILIKKESGYPLTKQEIAEGMHLIERARPTEGGVCWICRQRTGKKVPALFDTGLCKKHAQALLLKKGES